MAQPFIWIWAWAFWCSSADVDKPPWPDIIVEDFGTENTKTP
jgi:hypothetical protein